MDTIISVLIIVALLAAIGLCVYIFTAVSRLNAVLDDVKNITQSLKPIIANVQTLSMRLTPILDSVEALMAKIQPLVANIEGIASAAQDIAQKVDRQVDQVLFALNDAARLVQDIIRLIDDIRLQIIAPVTGVAQFISTAYKTVAGFIGQSKESKEVDVHE